MIESMLIFFTSEKSITKHILRNGQNPNTSGYLTTENEGAIIRKIKNLSLWPTTQTRDYPVPPPCRQGRQEGGPIGVREPVCEGFIVTLRYRFNLKKKQNFGAGPSSAGGEATNGEVAFLPSPRVRQAGFMRLVAFHPHP